MAEPDTRLITENVRHIVNASLRTLGTAIPINPVMDKLYQKIIPVLGLLPNETVVSVSPGQKFQVFVTRPRDLLNNPDYYIYYFGTWEPRLTRVLRRLIQPGDVCFDIGANIGWYTFLLGRLVGQHGFVHAFEPDPKAFAQLRANAALNEDTGSVHLNQLAMGASSGTLTLYGSDITLYSSLYNSGSAGIQEHIVPIETLDSFTREYGIEQIDFLKIDVEGSEFSVLKGGIDFLHRARNLPVIQLELNPVTARMADFQVEEMLTWLRDELGYRFYRVTLTGKLVELHSLLNGSDIQLQDIFCLKPGLHSERLSRA